MYDQRNNLCNYILSYASIHLLLLLTDTPGIPGTSLTKKKITRNRFLSVNFFRFKNQAKSAPCRQFSVGYSKNNNDDKHEKKTLQFQIMMQKSLKQKPHKRTISLKSAHFIKIRKHWKLIFDIKNIYEISLEFLYVKQKNTFFFFICLSSIFV